MSESEASRRSLRSIHSSWYNYCQVNLLLEVIVNDCIILFHFFPSVYYFLKYVRSHFSRNLVRFLTHWGGTLAYYFVSAEGIVICSINWCTTVLKVEFYSGYILAKLKTFMKSATAHTLSWLQYLQWSYWKKK